MSGEILVSHNKRCKMATPQKAVEKKAESAEILDKTLDEIVEVESAPV